MKLKCPECNEEQHCGCPACMGRREQPVVTQRDDATGELLSCGHCGYTTSHDGWLDIEVEQLEAAGLWPTED